jgi:tungstate transport system substrate-binding protein
VVSSCRRALATGLLALALGAAAGDGMAGQRALLLAATTSTENSGLLGHLLPQFEADTGIEINAVIAGSGAVLELARRGDVDVVLVHSPLDEETFVAKGYGIDRREVMFNDFVLVGPSDDPASIRGRANAAGALARIAAIEAPFLSRGDDSGTHRMELRQWAAAGLDPSGFGAWYRESGAGQGATLNIATGLGAYALTDRATWISFRNRSGLEVLVQGDPSLHNPYHVIRVDPARFPATDAADALALVEWLTSTPGQEAIESFRIEGEQVFFIEKPPSG